MGSLPNNRRHDRGSAERDANSASVSKGFAHAFHARLIADIHARAHGYRHRWRRSIAAVPPARSGTTSKGEHIRARIAANAQKRYEIAEAMKAEAGVVGHQLTGERSGGIAWTDRARILAPAGENRVQLATLAHECGHVFLHSIGSEGWQLPGHVKELEAESYAHQAFAAHGMRMPAQITGWGRSYVGQWVAEDRAAGIPIDPRAVAYANGQRSPYEPLRKIPASWTPRGRVAAKVMPASAFPKSWQIQKPRRVWRNLPFFRNRFVREGAGLILVASRSMLFGCFFMHLALKFESVRLALQLPLRRDYDLPTRDDLLVTFTAGIMLTCLVMSLVVMAAPMRRSDPEGDAG